VRRAGKKPESLGAGGGRRLGELYRAAAGDLALARRAFPGDPRVERLAALVGSARHLVYDAPPRRRSVRAFYSRTYWRRVAERPLFLLIAAVLTFAPAVLAGEWALRDPGAAVGLVPVAYRGVSEPATTGNDLGLTSEEKSAMSTEIFTNNIRVTLIVLAGGLTAGILTAFELLYNGVGLGVVAGLSWGAGNGTRFLELVVPHGVLELSCIVVAGAAGLSLGWSMIDPGRRTRREAIAAEARRTIEIVLGTAPWLVLAGLVEGFVTPSGFDAAVVWTVGLGLGVFYWSLVLWRGRAPRDEEEDLPRPTGALVPSPAGTR
jgi:uncharacterized membrane protein SpoIIM required for sporulation